MGDGEQVINREGKRRQNQKEKAEDDAVMPRAGPRRAGTGGHLEGVLASAGLDGGRLRLSLFDQSIGRSLPGRRLGTRVGFLKRLGYGVVPRAMLGLANVCGRSGNRSSINNISKLRYMEYGRFAVTERVFAADVCVYAEVYAETPICQYARHHCADPARNVDHLWPISGGLSLGDP